jgi:hypothetical protein
VVHTLGGAKFEITVRPDDSVSTVLALIGAQQECSVGANEVFPHGKEDPLQETTATLREQGFNGRSALFFLPRADPMQTTERRSVPVQNPSGIAADDFMAFCVENTTHTIGSRQLEPGENLQWNERGWKDERQAREWECRAPSNTH